ncbi:MAG: alpha/beta hydrolase [Deltaproteobacteria bacterium]|jgi:acylglycerol lipase|nr:alpha/beta hydrolase [Deltaproteobacteria bacterium]MBT6490843.1 alpha/beta hydrolase [Deltaproteobacteria bacterium]
MTQSVIQKKVWDNCQNHPFQLALWPKPAEPNGTLVVIHHGLGEHASRYEEVGLRLTELGFEVRSYDCRGHGQSLGKRGDAAGLDGLVSDFEEILPTLIDTTSCTRVVIMGHSMGGAVVGRYLTARPIHSMIEGAILSAPALAVPISPINDLKLRLGRVINRYMPTLTLPSGLDTLGISSDTSEVARYLADKWVHDMISTRLATGLIDCSAEVLKGAHRLSVPTLVYHGTEDTICAIDGSRQFARQAPVGMVALREIMGGRHELHHEVPEIKAQWWMHLSRWLTHQVADAKAA